jgi:hypothetical protein
MLRIFILTFLLPLLSCSTAFNLTDRSGNVFIIENPKLESNRNLEYRSGDATRELAIKEIVSLSVLNEGQEIFDGKIFYPVVLKLEDSLSVPAQGFICVEGIINAKNAGKKFSIPLANVKELSR